jgi:hypothetical protein
LPGTFDFFQHFEIQLAGRQFRPLSPKAAAYQADRQLACVKQRLQPLARSEAAPDGE